MHKKYLSTFAAVLFVTAFFFLSGCTQEDIGIFYSLEVESELEGDKGLDDELKVWEMVRTDSGTEDAYYIAAGKVFTRSAVSDDSEWSAVAAPSEGMLCSDMVYFNDKIFAVFQNPDGTVSNLYVYNSSSGWEKVTVDSASESERIMGIIHIEEFMYIEKFEPDEGTDFYTPYSLWHTADGSTFSRCSLANLGTDLADDISTRLIFDGDFDGTNYILVSGNAVYRSTDGSSFQEITLKDTGGDDILFTSIGGIYYSGSHKMLFISSQPGFIYINDLDADPDITANWHRSTDLDDSSLEFYDFAYVPAADGTDNILIVGSDEGYYEVPSLDDPAAVTPRRPGSEELTTTVNYLNTALSNGSIRKFFIDDDPELESEVIFALTTSYGLWQNRLIDDADPYRVWTRE